MLEQVLIVVPRISRLILSEVLQQIGFGSFQFSQTSFQMFVGRFQLVHTGSGFSELKNTFWNVTYEVIINPTLFLKSEKCISDQK